MCGICGQFNFQPEHTVEKEPLKRMKHSLAHRGPDDQGIWMKGHIGLGHTRLAVIDLSANGHQPMSNETGSIWITYNGEVYNFLDLRKELESKGHHFRSNSDTEVIVHLYEEEGVRCMTRLRGMFAFAIWDENAKQLLLARDRLGQKPLYYYQDKHSLFFASEIESILASGIVEISPDNEAIYQYLCLGYVPHPKTGFKGIKKLPPGHRMVVRDSHFSLDSYWSLKEDHNQDEIINTKEVSQRLNDLLMEATRIRMVSDVPIGVLLSGGIDSNAVAAMMSSCTRQIKTFTVGFEDELYDERREARFLADRLDTDHHEMVVKPAVLDILPKLACAYGEPFADPSAVPSYYVAQMARQHVKVVLNGDGGDENFAGYGTYIQGVVGSWTESIPSKLGGFLSRILDQKKQGKAKSLAQILALSGKPRARNFSHLKEIATLAIIESLLTDDYRKLVHGIDPISHLVECYERLDRGDIVNTMLAVDRETFLPDDLLFKIDIATMNHGLEARSPFLDHYLVEFAAKLPGRLKLNGWRKKYILKKSLKDILPHQVLQRRKRGFDVPVSRWLKGELKDLCSDTLSGKNLVTGLLKADKLKEMFNDHLAGRQDWGRFFWAVLMLHLWSEAYIKKGVIIGR